MRATDLVPVFTLHYVEIGRPTPRLELRKKSIRALCNIFSIPYCCIQTNQIHPGRFFVPNNVEMSVSTLIFAIINMCDHFYFVRYGYNSLDRLNIVHIQENTDIKHYI